MVIKSCKKLSFSSIKISFPILINGMPLLHNLWVHTIIYCYLCFVKRYFIMKAFFTITYIKIST